MTALLAVVVPVVFVFGLLARQPDPAPNARIPVPILEDPGDFSVSVTESRSFGELTGISYRVLGRAAGSPVQAIELANLQAVRYPALLLYWLPGDQGIVPEAGSLTDAYILGSWSVTTTGVFRLPERAHDEEGSLVLYSMAQGDIVGSTPLVNR